MSSTEASPQQREAAQTGPDGASVTVAALRLPALALVLVILAFMFIQKLPQDPILYQMLTRPFRADPGIEQAKLLARLRAKDPHLDSVLPIPQSRSSPMGAGPADTSLARASGSVTPCPTLVVMIGPCSLCALHTLRAADQLPTEHPRLRVVAVSPTPTSDLDSFRRTHHLRLALVSDTGGRLAARYNAAWSPRAYLLSSVGRLVWCQPDWNFAPWRVRERIAKGGAG